MLIKVKLLSSLIEEKTLDKEDILVSKTKEDSKFLTDILERLILEKNKLLSLVYSKECRGSIK